MIKEVESTLFDENAGTQNYA